MNSNRNTAPESNPKSPSKSQKDPKTHTTSRALILIDEGPIRFVATTEFRKTYKAYSRLLAQLKHHEEVVRPSYYRWFFGIFGSRLEKLSRLQSSLLQKSYLLQRMRELCLFEGFNRREAYEHAQEEQEFENLNEYDADFYGAGDDDSNDQASDQFSDYSSGSKHDGSSSGTDHNDENQFRSSPFDTNDAANGAEEQSPKKQTENQIKYFYRKLAQALHPDLAEEQNELSREFWLDTQEAYRLRDLERLKLIWTLVSLQQVGLSKDIRIFDLKAAVLHMKEKLNTAQKEKRRLQREDESWGFEKKSKANLASKIGAEMAREEDSLENALEDLEDELKMFASSSQRKKRRDERSQRPFSY